MKKKKLLTSIAILIIWSISFIRFETVNSYAASSPPLNAIAGKYVIVNASIPSFLADSVRNAYIELKPDTTFYAQNLPNVTSEGLSYGSLSGTWDTTLHGAALQRGNLETDTYFGIQLSQSLEGLQRVALREPRGQYKLEFHFGDRLTSGFSLIFRQERILILGYGCFLFEFVCKYGLQ